MADDLSQIFKHPWPTKAFQHLLKTKATRSGVGDVDAVTCQTHACVAAQRARSVTRLTTRDAPSDADVVTQNPPLATRLTPVRPEPVFTCLPRFPA